MEEEDKGGGEYFEASDKVCINSESEPPNKSADLYQVLKLLNTSVKSNPFEIE